MTAPTTRLDRSGWTSDQLIGHLLRQGDRTALLTADREVSYAELGERVRDMSAALGTARRLVLLRMTSTVDGVVAYLAALAGGHPVLLTSATGADADGLSAAYDPDVVLNTGHDRVDLVERRRGTAHELHPDLAVLLSTSGSTGSPKLVRLSHRNLLSNAASIAGYLDVRPSDRAVTSLPLHYCYGLSVLHTHLLRGAALVLTDRSVVDAGFWELVRGRGVTSLAGVPFTFELLQRAGFLDLDLPRLRYVTQAGGRLAPAQVRAFAEAGQRRGWDLFVMYGQTEATARMAYLPPERALTDPHAIGVPVPGGAFDLEPLDGADDGVGELVYTGPNVMLGYAESPADLARGATLDRLRTGDLARRTGDGLWEVVGRRSRFAKLFGLRLDLDRLEADLAGHGHTALVVEGDGVLVAAVEDCRVPRTAQRRLAQAAGVPTGAVVVVAVPELPRLAAGKPDHAAVRALASGVPGTAVPTASRPPDVLAALRTAYADVLDRADVDADDTFVALGGDSMSYVELSVRLEEQLGSLPAGWHTRTLRDLAGARDVPAGSRRLREVETGVVLRALGIVLVVGSHAGLFVLQGGAHVLLAVAGFNLARFRLGDGPAAVRSARLLRGAARVAVPTVVWVALCLWLAGDWWSVHNLLLLNAFLGPDVFGPTWQLWFVEALVWTVVGTAVLLRVPVLHRLERASPFAFALGVLAGAVALRFALLPPDGGPDRYHAPHLVLWFFAAGWAAAQARTAAHRWAVTAVVLLALPGFFTSPARGALVVAGLMLLVWCRTLPVPTPLVRAVAAVAGASLYVYLTHFQVLRVVEGPVLETALSLAVGLLCAGSVRPVGRRLRSS